MCLNYQFSPKLIRIARKNPACFLSYHLQGPVSSLHNPPEDLSRNERGAASGRQGPQDGAVWSPFMEVIFFWFWPVSVIMKRWYRPSLLELKTR